MSGLTLKNMNDYSITNFLDVTEIITKMKENVKHEQLYEMEN